MPTTASDRRLPVRLLKLLLLAAGLIGATSSAAPAAEPLLADGFTSAEHAGRRALRGDWKIGAGEATCIQDDALYAKYKNHGPIIFYDLPFNDATVRFAFKPQAAKTVVFTANGAEGHIFRAVWNKAGLTARAFPPDGDQKSVSAGKLSTDMPTDDEWLPVEIQLRGDRATIRSGADQLEVQHPSFDRPKTNLSIGFSFGSLTVKNLEVTDHQAR